MAINRRRVGGGGGGRLRTHAHGPTVGSRDDSFSYCVGRAPSAQTLVNNT